jgi:hypothetical protein
VLFGLPSELAGRAIVPPFPGDVRVKNRCEFDGALRNEAGLAARPEGLKLSRDGERGILPLTMRVCRKSDALMT